MQIAKTFNQRQYSIFRQFDVIFRQVKMIFRFDEKLSKRDIFDNFTQSAFSLVLPLLNNSRDADLAPKLFFQTLLLIQHYKLVIIDFQLFVCDESVGLSDQVSRTSLRATVRPNDTATTQSLTPG